MKAIITLFLFLFINGSLVSESRDIKSPELPEIKSVVQNYFGKKIADPYRYFENLKDKKVLKWFKENADYSRGFLDKIPVRQKLIKKMEEYNNRRAVRIYSVWILENDVYFYIKRKPEDQIGKLFYRKGLNGKEVSLFDPELLSRDSNKKYSLKSYVPSYRGKRVALVLSSHDSGSHLVRIIDVVSGKMFPEVIDRCFWPECSWLPDDSAFFYTRLSSNDISKKGERRIQKHFFIFQGQSLRRIV